ncbi:hypothetical protein [Hydrogenimonas urashimensis]|uniref:hypothetical protein n=1 Tax=Hydrogenimonas urashimensis TaxID=2740515 RepID=UPI0019151246|nr:hypothetical protein [Hydrogenimonas urashimensis]
MKEFAVEFFNNFSFFIVFLHVLGAIVWVGGMIGMRLAVHPGLQHIDDPKVRLARTLEIVRNLFALVLPFIVLILLTGFIMGLAVGAPGSELATVVYIKEAVWLVMTLNYAAMVYRRNRAERFFVAGDLSGAREMLAPIPNLMLPVNIALGVLALVLGIYLRGF